MTHTKLRLLSDDDPLAKAALEAARAAHGASNDAEIAALKNALGIALARAGVRVRDLTAEEIREAEEA